MATTLPPAPATSTITWEEFERLPDGDGLHREILQGVLQVLPPPKSDHSTIASNLFEILSELKRKGFGRVYLEAGYKLADNPPTWIVPDASFLSASRVAATKRAGYFTGAPELAVEIISPSESAKDVELKINLMLAAGAQAVWVVYPDTRTVYVFSPDGSSVKRGIGDALAAPFLSKEWSVPVAGLFVD